MLASLSATALAVILAASSTASSCSTDHPSGSPKPTVTLHQPQGKQADSSGIEVVPAHCTIVRHRNGDEDWVCEDSDPKHPKHYPKPKLHHGDRITGHADAG
jgi:hypothetical protein